MSQKKFHIITLGCKVNQYESQSLREAWLGRGLVETDAPEDADLVLLNSCAVTEKALADLRSTVRKVRRAAPECRVLVTGCAAQAMPEEVRKLPVDAVLSQREKAELLAGPENFWQQPGPFEKVERHNPLEKIEGPGPQWQQGPQDVGYAAFPPFSVNGYVRSRAILKVQDGCSQRCAYCIVPAGRGPSKSRPWPEVLAEAGRLADAGFGEIILNGVNLRQYRYEKEDFWSLLQRLEAALAPEWAGRLRLRISSLEPGQLDERALEALASSRLVAPHLHLSLQSGSPAVLKAMGRGHYSPHTLPDFLEKLGKIWPHYGLGADVIAGFPGETEDDFARTISICAALPLSYAHIFPYSPRPGTVAAALPGQLAPEVKKERAARLRALVAEKARAFTEKSLALPSFKVVLEDSEKLRGVNEFYTECRFEEGAEPRPRVLTTVRPLRLDKKGLLVRQAPEAAEF